MVVICLPFLVLLSQRLAIESFVWVGAAMTFLAWEVRQITRQIRGADETDVLYIGDDDGQRIATKRFDLRLRD
jgi:hypothetical protein